jgi:hypothetical protein
MEPELCDSTGLFQFPAWRRQQAMAEQVLQEMRFRDLPSKNSSVRNSPTSSRAE